MQRGGHHSHIPVTKGFPEFVMDVLDLVGSNGRESVQCLNCFSPNNFPSKQQEQQQHDEVVHLTEFRHDRYT